MFFIFGFDQREKMLLVINVNTSNFKNIVGFQQIKYMVPEWQKLVNQLPGYLGHLVRNNIK